MNNNEPDQEIIDIIKELHGVSEEVARELWKKFTETVKKLKKITEEQSDKEETNDEEQP